MKCRFPLLAFVLTLSIWTGPGFGISCFHAEAAETTITMFVPDTDWPPYIMNNPEYPDGGVFVEILRAVATPLGYTVTTLPLPNQRGWMMLENGTVDVHAKAIEWVPNAKDFLWTASFMQSEDVLLSPTDKPLEYSSPQKLYGKSIATIKGFIYPVFEPHFGPNKIERIDVTSPYAMLELLTLGRADAALVNRVETQWLMRNKPELNPNRFILDDTPCDSASYRFAFTRKGHWQPFIKEFNKTLKTMQKDGRLQAILDKYR
nr:ABC transporter substrate-binding protein [Pseudodesulfovibrio sp.]